jgi:aspartate 1-decarboxylase
MRIILKSKIHRAKITEAKLYYEGSITIDKELMKKADIINGEKVEVLNLNNGTRTETYAIAGKSGEICLNGPAARMGYVGDEVTILAYAIEPEDRIGLNEPKIVHVDENNRAKN